MNEVSNKITHKTKLKYDSEEELYFYVIDYESLKQRYNSRVCYFNRIKRRYNISQEVEDMFLKLLDFMYYEKSINYYYFMKKICDIFNIENNIKVQRLCYKVEMKYEKIWNDFLQKCISKNVS